jgi:hypothetical protein
MNCFFKVYSFEFSINLKEKLQKKRILNIETENESVYYLRGEMEYDANTSAFNPND